METDWWVLMILFSFVPASMAFFNVGRTLHSKFVRSSTSKTS